MNGLVIREASSKLASSAASPRNADDDFDEARDCDLHEVAHDRPERLFRRRSLFLPRDNQSDRKHADVEAGKQPLSAG
jgi:hypothetical protein